MYASWAESEDELRRPLEGVSSCVATCCRALEDQSEKMSQDFLPVLREYVLYVESMKVSPDRPTECFCLGLDGYCVRLDKHSSLNSCYSNV